MQMCLIIAWQTCMLLRTDIYFMNQLLTAFVDQPELVHAIRDEPGHQIGLFVGGAAVAYLPTAAAVGDRRFSGQHSGGGGQQHIVTARYEMRNK